MRFGLILGGVTILTIGLIFGVYKLFLDKPSPAPVPPLQIASEQTAIQSLPVSSDKPIPSPSVKVTPKPSQLKSTIGTLTVLQNNTSSAQASSQTAGSSTISGIISFTGTAPSGTSIVIVARANGTSDPFKTVVSGVLASNNTTWSWTTAALGKSYDMIAVLKGSSGGVDTDYAASQTYVVTAPALNQIFSVNAAPAPSVPTGTITTTCTTHNSNNTWTGTVNFPTVTGAQWYQLQVGTTSTGTDIANNTQAVQSGTNQTVNVTLNDSVSYYAQYAIASAPNPTSAQYSAFSTSMTIKCP